MIPINFKFLDRGEFWKLGIDVRYFDSTAENVVRELVVHGMKKYRTCEQIMKVVGPTQLRIALNKDVGNWYDNDTNTVYFDRSDKSLPHLVSGGRDITIPPLVCLFHELGHAKQWLENKVWYESAVQIRDKMGVAYQVEYDNLQKHEDPLLREMGLPIRKRYEFYVSEARAERIIRKGYSNVSTHALLNTAV